MELLLEICCRWASEWASCIQWVFVFVLAPVLAIVLVLVRFLAVIPFMHQFTCGCHSTGATSPLVAPFWAMRVICVLVSPDAFLVDEPPTEVLRV